MKKPAGLARRAQAAPARTRLQPAAAADAGGDDLDHHNLNEQPGRVLAIAGQDDVGIVKSLGGTVGARRVCWVCTSTAGRGGGGACAGDSAPRPCLVQDLRAAQRQHPGGQAPDRRQKRRLYRVLLPQHVKRVCGRTPQGGGGGSAAVQPCGASTAPTPGPPVATRVEKVKLADTTPQMAPNARYSGSS